ncbi:MAG: Isochorismatase [Labilithrix sp.]|jgi:nicotinamidase-related amidase|nr:Isochorismatase [Labilithrix sp.]
MERLDPATTLILVVDVQEKLAPAMPADTLATLLKNTGILLDTAKLLGAPVLASEQYPKGLGATVPALAEKLSALGAPMMPKMTFDACSDLAIARAISDLDPRAVVVVGMESHVCVFQTVRELVKRGYATHVVTDAVASRREENRQLGLTLCERAGAILTGTETVAFDLLSKAGTDVFKAVSKLVR